MAMELEFEISEELFDKVSHEAEIRGVTIEELIMEILQEFLIS
jgi:hypothetical protein